MLKVKSSSMYLIAFVALAMLLLTMLPSSYAREGMENSTTTPPPGPSITEIDTRLTALENSVNESKSKIASGEARANAAVGNLQMTLPA